MNAYRMIDLNRRLVLSLTRAPQHAHDHLSSTFLTTWCWKSVHESRSVTGGRPGFVYLESTD